MSKDTLKVSGVTYTSADDGYFEKRRLKRSAGVWGLWGLAVAAVISGDFSGWNFGIDFAGFGGMLIAFVILVAMYYGLIFSIGEMSSAMPHTGGAYSFSRAAMGPWGGFITGLAETIEYVATTAVIVYFSAAYADSITSELLGFSMPPWVWWLVLYVAFIALNAAGANISFKFAIVVSIISIAIILVFSAMAIVLGSLLVGCAVEHRARRRAERVPPARRVPRDPVRAALRDVVLPRHRGAAARRGGVARPRPRHPARRPVGPRHAHHHRPARAVPQHGRHRRRGDRRRGRAPARRLPRDRRRRARRSPRPLRADRPARLAPGHHVRLRTQHVLAVACRLLPEVPVADREAADPVGRARRRRRDRLRGVDRARRARRGRRGGCGSGRGRDRAEHRGVGRGARVPPADGRLRDPPAQVPERQAAVPQPLGRSGCDHRRRSSRR